MTRLDPIKRGDTFSLVATFDTTVQAAELRSEVRDGAGSLLDTCTITPMTDGVFQFMVNDTSGWRGTVYMDIRRTYGGITETSDTIEIPIVRAITL
ncbi:hypothetical protein [Paenibacillus sp. OV219]|uniref:hypothetical protein n=1 Tax=Paenibacillus sp. OV219 TaxID=1884377 RepID=UPI0008CA643B|nr:hypothetical protein [Paenibacillus sp. OV219]SEN19771.1 hypothetical protein SAMN05518847_102393 [Paenibacillus sp. OV219]